MIFKKLPINFEARIDELVEYAITVKKQGVLALEKDVQNINHEFLNFSNLIESSFFCIDDNLNVLMGNKKQKNINAFITPKGFWKINNEKAE